MRAYAGAWEHDQIEMLANPARVRRRQVQRQLSLNALALSNEQHHSGCAKFHDADLYGDFAMLVNATRARRREERRQVNPGPCCDDCAPALPCDLPCSRSDCGCESCAETRSFQGLSEPLIPSTSKKVLAVAPETTNDPALFGLLKEFLGFDPWITYPMASANPGGVEWYVQEVWKALRCRWHCHPFDCCYEKGLAPGSEFIICKDFEEDEMNCGGCGIECKPFETGKFCIHGECRIPCNNSLECAQDEFCHNDGCHKVTCDPFNDTCNAFSQSIKCCIDPLSSPLSFHCRDMGTLQNCGGCDFWPSCSDGNPAPNPLNGTCIAAGCCNTLHPNWAPLVVYAYDNISNNATFCACQAHIGTFRMLAQDGSLTQMECPIPI
jgi:hypothetical protein